MKGNEEVVIHCINGVGAHLIELDQHSTYQDLLDGDPTHEISEMLRTRTLCFLSVAKDEMSTW
jgi:hypothetical protein